MDHQKVYHLVHDRVTRRERQKGEGMVVRSVQTWDYLLDQYHLVIVMHLHMVPRYRRSREGAPEGDTDGTMIGQCDCSLSLQSLLPASLVSVVTSNCSIRS
jgi:hypothetical protein